MEALSGIQNCVVGIIAGCIQCSLDHPLITAKNMVQQNLPLSLNPRILYRGTVADMFGLSSLTANQFFGTGAIKNLILEHKRSGHRLTRSDILLSSLGGGLLSGIIVSPWELSMIHQQRDGGQLVRHLHAISRQNVRLLTRGMVPSMCREGIFTCGYLGANPLLEHYVDGDGMAHKFGCAMVSGVAAVLLSHPFDTINTCMKGDLHSSTYRGVAHSFRHIYGHYGLRRIYAGASFRFGTVVLAFFVFNRVMEFVAPKIYHQQFEDLRRSDRRSDDVSM